MSGRGGGIGPGVKTRGGRKVVIDAVLAPDAPRAALATRNRASSSKAPSEVPNPSQNNTTDVLAAGNTSKRLLKKTAPAVCKEATKKLSQAALPEVHVEATTQQLNIDNSAEGATLAAAAVGPLAVVKPAAASAAATATSAAESRGGRTSISAVFGQYVEAATRQLRGEDNSHASGSVAPAALATPATWNEDTSKATGSVARAAAPSSAMAGRASAPACD